MILFFEYKNGFLQYCIFDGGKQVIRKFTYCALNDLVKLAEIGRVTTIGYRFMDAGTLGNDSVLDITDANKKIIQDAVQCAPENNSIIFEAICICGDIFPAAKHCLVCDDAFSSSLPEFACLYALPYELSQKGIKKQGKQGLFHQWAYKKSCELSQEPVQKLISIALGDNINLFAIKEGEVVDMSNGFEQGSEIISKTGCGKIDSSIVFSMMADGELREEVEKVLTRESGWKAIVGKKCGLIEILTRQDSRACLAKEITLYQICQQIGAQIAVLGGLDSITFFGIQDQMLLDFACEILSKLKFMGVKLKGNIPLEGLMRLTTNNSAIESYFLTEDQQLIILELLQKNNQVNLVCA